MQEDIGTSGKNALQRWRTADFGMFGAFVKAVMAFVGAILAITLLLYGFSAGRELFSRIPAVIQVFSYVIVALAGVLTKIMLSERNDVLKDHAGFLSFIKPLGSLSAAARHRGILPEKIEELRKKSQSIAGPPKEWWGLLDESLETYAGLDGLEGCFTLRPIQEILDEETLVWSGYHTSFYQAVPGILTALGLLGTFVAILQGLSGVSYNPLDTVHPVTGIDSLINGLSGKFVTSIVALVVSIIFTFVEKKLCDRRVLQSYHHLLSRCRESIPFLPSSRILIDLRTAVSRGNG